MRASPNRIKKRKYTQITLTTILAVILAAVTASVDDYLNVFCWFFGWCACNVQKYFSVFYVFMRKPSINYCLMENTNVNWIKCLKQLNARAHWVEVLLLLLLSKFTLTACRFSTAKLLKIIPKQHTKHSLIHPLILKHPTIFGHCGCFMAYYIPPSLAYQKYLIHWKNYNGSLSNAYWI